MSDKDLEFTPPVLTQALVRELFNYCPITGNLTWKFPLSNRVASGELVRAHNGKYFCVSIRGRNYKVHRVIFLYHHGWLPSQIDHINRDKNDNHIENLRPATASENSINWERDNTQVTSKYRGVFQEREKLWVACAYKNGKRVFRKRFASELKAAAAYNRVAKEGHGEFAVLNEGVGNDH